MRTIEFQRTFDDLLAFSLFLRERLGVDQKQKWYGLAAALFFFGGAAAWHYHSSANPVVLVVYAAGAVAYTLLWPRLNRACVRYYVKRSARTLYPGPPTTHQLTLGDRGVEERSSEGDTFVSWSGIPDIARTDRHIFVFTGPATAHIVPLSAFPTCADAEAFVTALQERGR